MELEVWFDKWQYHCTTDIGESAVKWKTIKELDVDLELVWELGLKPQKPRKFRASRTCDAGAINNLGAPPQAPYSF